MSIITKRSDFESIEKDALVTLPNVISLARALGGLVLGAAMYKGAIDPSTAAVASAGLAISDAEGSLINLAKRWPSGLRDGLRIWPSKQGVVTDVAADKVYMGGILAGGIFGGYINKTAGLMLIPELATVVASVYATKKLGHEPTVNKTGKWGMISRFSVVSAYLMSSAMSNETMANIFEKSGHGLTVAALGLGALSCYDVYKQGRDVDNQNGIELVNPLPADN